MLFGLLSLIGLLFLSHGARAEDLDDLGCGIGSEPCPSGTRCVPAAGCVALENAHGCQCKQTPCPWPLQCDCQGGCRERSCSSTPQCGRRLTDPRNKCRQMLCMNGGCSPVAVNCSAGHRCDKDQGCVAVATNANAAGSRAAHQQTRVHPRLREQQTQQAKAKQVVQPQQQSDDQVQLKHWHGDTEPSEGRNNSFVIFLIVFLSFWGLLLLAWFIYACYNMWPSRKSATL